MERGKKTEKQGDYKSMKNKRLTLPQLVKL